MENTVTKKMHNISIENRSRAHISGVTNVISVSSAQILLSIDGVTLIISGSNLEVKSFNVTDGTFSFSGNLDSLKYGGKTNTEKSFLKRVFK